MASTSAHPPSCSAVPAVSEITHLSSSEMVPVAHSPNSNQKIYRPLDKARREIRLILLDPLLDPSGKLQCRLITSDLDDCKPFTALSYCWGDESFTVPILVNGHEHQITTNLADFLQRMRQKMENPELLWIDALSINQNDIEERNHQVPLMRTIYKSAERVIAWLGEAEEGSDVITGLWLFKELASTAITYDNDELVIDHVQDATSFAWASFKAVLAIQDRPWWNRRWVVQEAVLPENLWLFCGSFILMWEEFMIGMDLWEKICLKAGPDALQAANFCMVKIHQIRQARDNAHRLEGNHPTLIQLLQNFRRLKQKLPHDSLYALHGLASDGREYIPDYGKPATEVFFDFAIKTTEMNQNLDILEHCQFGLQTVSGLPSWVPDWTTKHGKGVRASHRFNPALKTKSSFIINAKERILTIDAVGIGTVVSVSCELHPFWDMTVWESILSTLAPQHRVCHESSRGKALFRTVHLDLEDFWERFQVDSPLFRLRLFRFQSAIARLNIPVPPTFFTHDDLPRSLNSDVAKEPLVLPEVYRFDEDCGPGSSVNKKVFLLGSGYLGTTECEIQSDDLVCIILGFSFPAILRRVAGGYQYIGICFVLDFMDGEAIRMVDEGELRVESFDLI